MSKKDKIQHRKVKGTEMVFRSISLPASLVEDLKLLKEAYEETWKEGGKRERVTYEKIFERLLSRSGLGHVDPDVYAEFLKVRETRKEFGDVVTRATGGAVLGIFKRMQGNGTSLFEEALKEQEEAEAALEDDRRAAAASVDSPAPAEDQVQTPEPVATPEVPVDPTEGEVWNMRYFFERDGEEIEAYRGYWPGFFAEVDGEERDQKEMMADGWVLMNEAGIEISPAQAIQISIEISSREAFEKTAYGQNLSLEEEGENIQESPSGAAVDSPAPAEDLVQSPEPVATPEVTQGKRSEKRFVHSDGRQYPALEGSLTPYYAKVPGRGNVGQRDMFKDGFELKDVEV